MITILDLTSRIKPLIELRALSTERVQISDDKLYENGYIFLILDPCWYSGSYPQSAFLIYLCFMVLQKHSGFTFLSLVLVIHIRMSKSVNQWTAFNRNTVH